MKYHLKKIKFFIGWGAPRAHVICCLFVVSIAFLACRGWEEKVVQQFVVLVNEILGCLLGLVDGGHHVEQCALVLGYIPGQEETATVFTFVDGKVEILRLHLVRFGVFVGALIRRHPLDAGRGLAGHAFAFIATTQRFYLMRSIKLRFRLDTVIVACTFGGGVKWHHFEHKHLRIQILAGI